MRKHARDWDQATLLMFINDISRQFHQRMRRESDRMGISSAYQRILFHLAHQDGVRQQELVDLTHLKPSSISVTLQKMEQDGLITRCTDGRDQRQTNVYLTPEGRKLDDAIRQKAKETEQIFMQGVDEETLPALKQNLKKILENALSDNPEHTERRGRHHRQKGETAQ